MSQVTAGSTDAPGVLMSGLVTFLLNHWGYLVILALLLPVIARVRRHRHGAPGFSRTSPRTEILDGFGGQDHPLLDDPDIAGPTHAAEHLRAPNPPAAGIADLADHLHQFSEPRFLSDARRVITAACTGRDRSTLSEGALENLGPPAQEIRLGPARVVSADWEEPWARAEVRFEALRTEQIDGQERLFHTTERWSFARKDGEDWQVRQILDRDRALLAPPSLERGRGVEPGTSLPDVVAPELLARRAALEAAHPGLDLTALADWAPEAALALMRALDGGDAPTLPTFVSEDASSDLTFEADCLAPFGLRRRLVDPTCPRATLVRAAQDPSGVLVVLRVYLSARTWLERADGTVAGGDPDHPRRYSEYWTFLGPGQGALPQQGFRLWRREPDEDYNG